MTVRKCLHCFKRIPEAGGPCPHCGKLNTSIGSKIAFGLVLSVLAAMAVGVVYGGVRLGNRLFDGDLFRYKADVVYEFTSKDSTLARVTFTNADCDTIEMDDMALPLQLRVEDLVDGSIASASAIPKDEDATVLIRIYQVDTGKVIGEGQNYPLTNASPYNRVASAQGLV